MTRPSVARIYRGTARNLDRLASLLQRGELVAVPTETVYGLAANALDAVACRKIFKAKGRPTRDPLIVHIHAIKELDAIAEKNPAALKLAKAFWPGPLTIVLPKRRIVPDIVSAGLPSVAVRMPAHPLFRRLLKLAARPLAAPSANVFGYVSPTTAEHVRNGLGKKIRHILDGGPSRIGVESTIVDLRDPARPRLLRPGAVTRAELEQVLGRKVKSPDGKKTREREVSAGLVAPGLMKRHYSPRTPVQLHESMPAPRLKGEAWLFIARPDGPLSPNTFWLDETGDLRGAARRLFAMLRQLDQGGFGKIHAELPQGAGLAEAIIDRLRRAAAK